MRGIELKEILKNMGVSLPDLAKKMGYKAEENLYSKLRSDDIKTNLLEDIAKATNKNISYFYNENVSDITDCENVNNSNAVMSIVSELVKSNSELVKTNSVLVNTNSNVVEALLQKQ